MSDWQHLAFRCGLPQTLFNMTLDLLFSKTSFWWSDIRWHFCIPKIHVSRIWTFCHMNIFHISSWMEFLFLCTFYHFDFLHIDQLYVSGCWNDEFYLDSTEILQDGEWVQGKMNNTICYILEKFRSHNTLVAAWCSTQQSTHWGRHTPAISQISSCAHGVAYKYAFQQCLLA